MPEHGTHTDAYGCRNSGMPLGGIGAGSLELRPDGHFYNWFLMNNRPWGAAPETASMEAYGLRFGLTYDRGDGVHCLALEKCLGRDPAPDGWFWMSDAYHLPWIRHAREIAYRARVPFARLAYCFDECPLEIGLTAWSPFIPHQAADSNTPGAVLTFRVANRAASRCRVSLLGLLKNAAGYDRPDLVSEMEFRAGPPAMVLMTRRDQPADAATSGTLALGVAASVPMEPSWALHPYPGRCVWDPLMKTGRLGNADHARLAAGPVGDQGAEKRVKLPTGTQRGALCAHVELDPGQIAEITFLLAWHFPNLRESDAGERKGAVIGAQYANRFADAAAVAQWLHAEHGRLLEQTRRFAEAFDRATLPAWMLDAIGAAWSVLLRAAWWDRAGRFGIWEGLGCCGLQTIDVGHYASFPVLQFFPELDASQMRLSAANLTPDGKVPHLMPGSFCCSDDRGGRGRIDLGPQYVLAVWRHALWTGDRALAAELWPVVERNLELMAAYDANGDGLPDNQGKDQTYDQFPMFGTTSFVGFLYLAALRAAAEMAHWLGKPERARHYAALAGEAAPKLESQLWNGEYYNLSHERARAESNRGCLADQLNGDWFYRQACGRPLVSDEHARGALASVLRLNRRRSGPAAWLANCVWPGGGGVEIRLTTSDQANSPWSGVEYAVAAHLILLGMREEGRALARDVFRRYEDAGLRFQHSECGEFYYRAMSAWALLLAETGFAYDGFAGRLTLYPQDPFSAFPVVLPGGYALAEWNGRERTLRLRALGGVLRVGEIAVGGERRPAPLPALRAGDEVVLQF